MTFNIGNETHRIDVFGGSVSEDKYSRLLSKEQKDCLKRCCMGLSIGISLIPSQKMPQNAMFFVENKQQQTDPAR